MNATAPEIVAETVRYAAARFRTNTLSQQELRDLVDQMMYQNIWYDEFLTVLDPESPWPDDALPAIEKALGHFGLLMPSMDEANRLQVERLLRPVAEGLADPVEGLTEFMRQFYWEYEVPDPGKQFGESLGVEGVVALYYQLDDWLGFKPNLLSDPADAREVSQLKAKIVRAAQTWLENRAGQVRN